MKPFLYFLIIFNSFSAIGQKPIIDSKALSTWQVLGQTAGISADGNYFFFPIYSYDYRSVNLMFKSTNNSWNKEFSNVSIGYFSEDSKHAFLQRHDTLFFITLGSDQIRYIAAIKNFKQPETKGRWLAYQLKDQGNQLILHNLVSGQERRFFSVVTYDFGPSGDVLLLQTSTSKESISVEYLKWIDMQNGKMTTVWSGNGSDRISASCFDATGGQIGFIVTQDDLSRNSMWHYRLGMKQAKMIADDRSAGIDPGLSISGSMVLFNSNGQYILFMLQELLKDKRIPNEDNAQVDIWNYKDSVLQSVQLYERVPLSAAKEYVASIAVSDRNIIRLEQKDESFRTPLSQVGKFAIITDKYSIKEYWSNGYKEKSSYLVSLKDGSRQFMNSDTLSTDYSFSPAGKYVIFYDLNESHYFCYDLLTGVKNDISSSVPTNLKRDDLTEFNYGFTGGPVGIVGWLPADTAVLIYDNYDIWQLDPLNKVPPKNITNGYGQSHQIKFRSLDGGRNTIYSTDDTLILLSFNPLSKENGFYRKSISKKGNPELLSMEKTFTFIHSSQANGLINFEPIKAKRSNEWIVKRQSATDAPNLFLTKDFITYTRLTDIEPQRKYNWLTTELITWKQLDGSLSQGILYKPENFDSKKRYPVIFNYYEDLSQKIYEFPQPDYTPANVNIPWFVSRGYLVFIPDIHYAVGKTGESACNSIVSAAQHLSKFHWVDTSKMGVQGHSFGGYETNYLVTHTHLFAASVSAAGPSDLISDYGGLNGINGNSTQSRYEYGQLRIGDNLWNSPDLFILNSPIFKVDQVVTPLLIMHNKEDDAVPWTQSVEFFTGLRRLGKKVWMLQYDNGHHGVRGKEAIDYTIRITQFFDHYLKGYPPPAWMTQGRPANLKQIDDRFELDPAGSCGDDCKICQKKDYQNLEILDVINPNTIKYKVDANMQVTRQSTNPNQ